MSNMAAKSAVERNAAMGEVADAFRAKHGLEPDDVMVEIKRLPNNRVLWSVRKKSNAEHAHLEAKQLAVDTEALAMKPEPVVYLPVGSWFQKQLFSKHARVYLSELGAR